jgi:hypothetical protein
MEIAEKTAARSTEREECHRRNPYIDAHIAHFCLVAELGPTPEATSQALLAASPLARTPSDTNNHEGFWVHTRMALTGVVGHTTSHAPQPVHLSLTTG